MTIEFRWDSRDLEIWRGNKTEKALARALRLAGNAAIRTVQKESSGHILSKKYLRESEVKDGLPLIFPGTRTEIRALQWTELVSGKPIQLIKFPHVATSNGILIRISKGTGTKRIASGFLATMKSGRKGIFMRRGKARLPIDELYTTRLSDSMSNPATIVSIYSKAYPKMQATFDKGLIREFKKLKRKGTI